MSFLIDSVIYKFNKIDKYLQAFIAIVIAFTIWLISGCIFILHVYDKSVRCYFYYVASVTVKVIFIVIVIFIAGIAIIIEISVFMIIEFLKPIKSIPAPVLLVRFLDQFTCG